MLTRLLTRRQSAGRLFALFSMMWLAACQPLGPSSGTVLDGPTIDPSAPVQVALLLPQNTGDPGDDIISRDLENAARLAIGDLAGVRIDLRVYSSGADPVTAGTAVQTAIADGAQIILGPLRAEQANAAGVAAAGSGINILAFSNNPNIAGGNVFVLGPTFRNTATRLVQYGNRNGLGSYMIVHSDDLAGQIGRDSITAAVQQSGGSIAGVQSYTLSQESILQAAPRIAAATTGSGADAVFLTANLGADLPLLATALPENGLDPAVVRYMGLTRWDATAQTLALPGLQEGLFAIPDQSTFQAFQARYENAYGAPPHPLAGLAYDGIAAIGALVAQGDADALTRARLTQPQGFRGTAGIFRLLPDGTNERGLAVATIRNNQVVILEPAPSSFGGSGS